jgi:hypothetical protein
MLSRLLPLILLLPSLAFAGANDNRRVNDLLQTTNSKMELDRQKTVLENSKTAPLFDRTPTYDDPVKYHSYGVETPQRLPFDDLDLDHMAEPPTPSE